MKRKIGVLLFIFMVAISPLGLKTSNQVINSVAVENIVLLQTTTDDNLNNGTNNNTTTDDNLNNGTTNNTTTDDNNNTTNNGTNNNGTVNDGTNNNGTVNDGTNNNDTNDDIDNDTNDDNDLVDDDNNNFVYNIISGVVGLFLGAVLTYFAMTTKDTRA